MKKCTHCGRNFNDYNYTCCPRCLKFVDIDKRRNKLMWKIIAGTSGILLFANSVYFISLFESEGVDCFLFAIPFIVLGSFLLYSKIKKDERRKEYLKARIIECLIAHNVDIYQPFGITSELSKIIDEGITKND